MLANLVTLVVVGINNRQQRSAVQIPSMVHNLQKNYSTSILLNGKIENEAFND